MPSVGAFLISTSPLCSSCSGRHLTGRGRAPCPTCVQELPSSSRTCWSTATTTRHTYGLFCIISIQSMVGCLKKKDIFFCRMVQCPVSSDIKAATLCSRCSRSVSLCSLLLHNWKDGCVEALQWRGSGSPPRPGGPEPARARPGKGTISCGVWENLVLRRYIFCACWLM